MCPACALLSDQGDAAGKVWRAPPTVRAGPGSPGPVTGAAVQRRPDPGHCSASWPDPECPPLATVSRVAPRHFGVLRKRMNKSGETRPNCSLLAPKLLNSNLKRGPNHPQPRDPTGLPLQASNSLWRPGLRLLEEMGARLLIIKPAIPLPLPPYSLPSPGSGEPS